MDRDSSDDAPQQLVGFRTNEEWDALVAGASDSLGALENIEDEKARAVAYDALDALEAIHGEALTRLVRLFKAGVLETVITDPAINTLMGMYGLLPPKEPGCRKVWDFFPHEDEKEPIAAKRPDPPPHWVPAPIPNSLGEGVAAQCEMENGPYLMIRAQGHWFAVAAYCPIHEASMLNGRNEGVSWQCPHGPACSYDLRDGRRLGGGPQLDCRPVRVEESGRILVGFGMPFEPNLPAF